MDVVSDNFVTRKNRSKPERLHNMIVSQDGNEITWWCSHSSIGRCRILHRMGSEQSMKAPSESQ